MLMLTLANAGGVGGGGLVIPCFIVFFYFDERETVALAALANAEASLIRFVLNFNDRHPEKKQTMIDYDLVIMMLPLALLGSIIGIIINDLLPALLVLPGRFNRVDVLLEVELLRGEESVLHFAMLVGRQTHGGQKHFFTLLSLEVLRLGWNWHGPEGGNIFAHGCKQLDSINYIRFISIDRPIRNAEADAVSICYLPRFLENSGGPSPPADDAEFNGHFTHNAVHAPLCWSGSEERPQELAGLLRLTPSQHSAPPALPPNCLPSNIA